MSKLCEKLKQKKFVITAELFPPKGTDISVLMKRADIVGPLVDGINVTDNQRACMRLGSIAISHLLLDKGYEPIVQMTCRDRNRIALQSDLLSAYVLGVRNILILSGDHPSVGEYKDIKGVYDLDTIQLLQTVRKLQSGEDLTGGKLKGAPEFCVGAVVNPTASPIELQIAMMEKKVKAGAQFFQTQTVFDTDKFRKFFDRVKEFGAKVLPGVTLLKSPEFVKFLGNLPGVTIPEEVIKRINSSKDPLREGIRICAETIKELKKFADGVHIMAIGMEEYIPEILKEVG